MATALPGRAPGGALLGGTEHEVSPVGAGDTVSDLTIEKAVYGTGWDGTVVIEMTANGRSGVELVR